MDRLPAGKTIPPSANGPIRTASHTRDAGILSAADNRAIRNALLESRIVNRTPRAQALSPTKGYSRLSSFVFAR